jgi:hypothetical protein
MTFGGGGEICLCPVAWVRSGAMRVLTRARVCTFFGREGGDVATGMTLEEKSFAPWLERAYGLVN